MTTTEKTPREILLEAAALGKRVGVAKGHFNEPGTGKMCINGLIGTVIRGSPIDDSAQYWKVMKTEPMQAITEALWEEILLIKSEYPGYSNFLFEPESHWSRVADWNNGVMSSPAVDNSPVILGVIERAAERFTARTR